MICINPDTKYDILINNASWSFFAPVESFSEDAVLAEIKTMYFGRLRLIRAVLP